MRVAIGNPQIDRPGIRRAAQRQHAAADHASGHRRVIVRAMGRDHDPRLAVLLIGGDAQVEICLQPGQHGMHTAIHDPQLPDLRSITGTARRELQLIVGFAVRSLHQIHPRVLQGDQRQDQPVVEDLVPEVDLHDQMLCRGKRRAGPLRRITDHDVVSDHPRHTPQPDVQMRHGDRTADVGGGARIDQRDEPVPVPEHDDRNDEQHRDAGPKRAFGGAASLHRLPPDRARVERRDRGHGCRRERSAPDARSWPCKIAALCQAGCRSPLNNHPGQFMPIASLRAITGGPTVSVVQKWRLERRKTAGETRL